MLSTPHALSDEELAGRLILEETSPVPLYVQLRESLRVLADERGPGAAMPSETRIAAATGVSRITVRRAVSDLTHDHVLVTKRGRGTVVAMRQAEETMQIPEGFTRVMEQSGHRASSIVLSLSQELPTSVVAEALGLAVDEGVFVLKRIRLMSGEPCMIETAHLPASFLPGFAEQDLTGSMYELLQVRYDLVIGSGTERIGAAVADRATADALGIKARDPLLTTVRQTRTEHGTPIEYTERLARPDLLAFRVQLGAGSVLHASDEASQLVSSTVTDAASEAAPRSRTEAAASS